MAAVVALVLIVAVAAKIAATRRRPDRRATPTTGGRVRGCPRCGHDVDAAARTCPTCGHVLPTPT